MAFNEVTGSIDFFGVHPQYRKRGIAKAFCEKALYKLARSAQISVVSTNRATKIVSTTVYSPMNIIIKIVGNANFSNDFIVKSCDSGFRSLIFTPASILQVLFQNLIVTAGCPGMGMVLGVSAGIANILLDYIFMVPVPPYFVLLLPFCGRW